MEIDDFKFNQPMSFVSPGAADGEYIVSEILEPPSQDISILASGHEEKITVQSVEHNTNTIDSYKILQGLQQSVYAERLERPPYALRDLIILAITCSPDKCMSVNSIKKFIQDLFLYYRHNNIWEQSVKLCLKRGKFRMFECNCDPVMQTQGCYMSDLDLWTIDPHWADTNIRSAFTMSPSLKRKNREIQQVEKNKMMKTSVEQDDISEEEVVFGDSPEEMTNNTIFLEDNNSHKFFGGNRRLKELFKELTEAEDCLSLIQPPPFTNSLFITLVLVSGTGDSFTTTQIVDTITQMFPYFAKCDKKSLRRSVLRTLSEKRKVFLKTSSEFDKEGSWNLRLSIDSVISILDKAADHIRPKKYLSLDKESSPMKKKRKASSANQKVGAQVSSEAEEQDEIGLWERQDLLMPCNHDTPLEKKCKEEVIHIPKSSHDTKDQGLAANPKKVGEGQEKFYVKSEPTDEETDSSSFEISFDSYDDETVYTDGCDEEICKPEISQVSEEVNQSMSIVSAGCEGSEKSLETCQRSINDEDNIGGGSPEASLLELKTAYVRIKRSLMLDTFAEDFKRRKNCRRKVSLASGFPCIPWAVENSIDPWKGWSAPSAELVKTRQSLQCIIDNTEKLLQLAFENDMSVMSREKSATVSDVTEKTDHIATECVVEQPLGHNGMDKTCSQKGFLGFDLDYWFGCWRGWQERDVQTSMKHRDHVRQLVRKMTLIQALEECEHTMDCTVQALDDRRLQKCNLLQTSPQQNSTWKAKHQAMSIRVKQRLQEFLQSVQDVCTEPPFSYTVMLVMALVSVDPPCLPLSKIFQFIQNKFPFYQDRDTWKKSVCVTLSLNTAFSKTCGSCHSKSGDHDCCWQIDLDTAIDILARAFKLEPDEVPVIQQTESPNVLQEKVDRELKSPASKERVKCITEEKRHALLKADVRHRTSISRKLKTIKAKRRNGSLDENRQDNSRVNVQLQFEADVRHRTSISRKLKIIKAKRRNGSLDENRQDNSRINVQLQFETGDIHIPECFDMIQKKTNKKSASLESKEKQDSLTEVIKKQLNDLLQCVEVVTSEPPFSYTVLIVMALVSSEKLSLQLSEIYEFIKDKFPYYRDRETWQSSVRGTLQLNNFFSKACKSSCNRNTQNHDGCWKIAPLTASEVLKRALETNRNKMEFMLYEECLVENKVVNQVTLKRSPSPKLKNSDDVLQVLRLEEYLKINYSKFLVNSRAILNIKEAENTSKMTDMSVVYNTVQLQDSLVEEHCDSVDNLTSKTDDSFEKYRSSDLSNTDPKEKSEIVNEKSTVDGEQSKCFESETNVTDYELKIVECYPYKKYDPPRLNKHQSLTKTFGTETFICNICDKQFSCPFVLTQHKFSHSQIKTNPCYDCHEVFPGKEALIIHRSSEHTNEKNQHKKSPNCQSCLPQKDFECKFCVLVFPSKLSLDLHMENTHK